MVAYNKVAKRTVHHVCIFGDPKTGKSTLAATLAEKGYKLVWISCDNGHTILDKLSPEGQSKVNLISIRDTKENPIAIHTVTKLTDGGTHRVCDTHGIINCSGCGKSGAEFTTVNLSETGPDTIVVLDHGSQVSDSAINMICKKYGKNDPDSYKLEYDDWALLGAMMSRILSNIQQAPYHIIVIAHTVETKMEDGTDKLVPQMGTVRFARNVAKYFDHIIFTGVRGNKHEAGSKTTFKMGVVTGSRTDVAIEADPVPDMLKIFGPPPIIDSTEEKEGTVSFAEKDAQSSTATTLKQIVKTVEEAVSDFTGIYTADVSGTVFNVKPVENAGTIADGAKDALARLRGRK